MKQEIPEEGRCGLPPSYEAAICSTEILCFETVLKVIKKSYDYAHVCTALITGCQSHALYRFAVM
jgi:hypothetical protein